MGKNVRKREIEYHFKRFDETFLAGGQCLKQNDKLQKCNIYTN